MGEGLPSIRLTAIGAGNVGKSSLFLRYCEDEFQKGYTPTTVSLFNTEKRRDRVTWKILIQDYGWEYWNLMKPRSVTWPDVFLMVYSVTKRDTLDFVASSVTKLKSERISPALYILVGSKCDLDEQREVSFSDGEALSTELDCPFIEVSSSTGTNIKKLFSYILKDRQKNGAGEIRPLKKSVDVRTPSNARKLERQLSFNELKKVETPSIVEVEQGIGGYLCLKSHNRNIWKRRWFVLSSTALRYYGKPPASSNDTKSLLGMIAIKNCKVLLQSSIQRKKDGNTFTFHVPPTATHEQITSTGREYYLWAESAALKQQWVERVNAAIDISGEQSSEAESWKVVTTETSPEATAEEDINSVDIKNIDPSKVDKTIAKHFNKKPKNGMRLLYKLSPEKFSADSILQYLQSNEDIKKSVLGDFFGEGEKFNQRILIAYLNTMDFKGVTLDDSLRLFLQGFRLPGEAQKIDRMMEKFAQRWYEVNSFQEGKQKEPNGNNSLENESEEQSPSPKTSPDSEGEGGAEGEGGGESGGEGAGEGKGGRRAEGARNSRLLPNGEQRSRWTRSSRQASVFNLNSISTYMNVEMSKEDLSEHSDTSNSSSGDNKDDEELREANNFFYSNNFESADTAYVLAFALIMLNTDAHNPAIKVKMSVEQFIENSSRINGGKDLPSEYLTQLYNNITQNKIEMENERDDIQKWEKQGWMEKENRRNKKTNLFFILSGSILLYFTDPQEKMPIGVIPLENIQLEQSQHLNKNKITLLPLEKEAKIQYMKHGSLQYVNKLVFYVSNQKEFGQWTFYLQEGILHKPVYESVKHSSPKAAHPKQKKKKKKMFAGSMIRE